MTENSTTILPPKPDDLAIAFAAALMMSGKYENPGSAIGAAWAAVPEFYLSRQHYAEQIAPMFFVSKTSEPEGEFEFAVKANDHI